MYSQLFKTVFVHVPRTGGQSVETAFLHQHGLRWQERSALLLGKNSNSGSKPKYLAHLLAREYVGSGYLAPDVFASSLKFTIARNPFDRLLSEYRYRAQRRAVEFAEFLKLLASGNGDRHVVPASDYVVDESGTVIVDKIIRFESLSRDFALLAREIFGYEVELPHVNRAEALIPVDALTFEVRNLICRRYERDFDLFQYPRGLEFHHILGSS
jgi:hypothetical protein